MKTHVDTMEVSISGGNLPRLGVQSFELHVAVNAIPAILLTLNPVEPPAEGGDGHITASAPNIEDLTRLYNQLLGYAAKLATTATIKLKLVRDPDDEAYTVEEQDQEVTLEDWILTDVGLSSVESTSAPYLTATFSHPAVMLDKTGMIYEEVSNPAILPQEYKTADGTDLISFMDDMYQKYASGGDIEFYRLANEMQGGMSDKFIDKVMSFRTEDLEKHSPGVYIKDNTKDLFLASMKPQFIDIIKQSAGPLVCPEAFCGTTWNRLITAICPYFLTVVVPTYDKKRLLLEPNSPWQASLYKVNTPTASAVDMPPLDPCPIVGTAINKQAWATKHKVNSANDIPADKGDEVATGTFSFYAPQKVLDNDVKGPILNIGEARLIANLVHLDAHQNVIQGGDAPKGKDPETAGGSVEDLDQVDMDTAYAEALFLMNYRKNCTSSVVLVPVFKDADHNMIYPGRVVTVNDTVTRKSLLYGYIVKMMVKGSKQGGCTTVLELTHVRPTEEDREIYVDEGTENPCYDSKIDRSNVD